MIRMKLLGRLRMYRVSLLNVKRNSQRRVSGILLVRGFRMSLDVCLMAVRPTALYSANITHNLNKMAEAAGIYQHLWHPDEIGIEKAAQLIEPLKEGLQLLESKPEHFQQFNPQNGWGSY